MAPNRRSKTVADDLRLVPKRVLRESYLNPEGMEEKKTSRKVFYNSFNILLTTTRPENPKRFCIPQS